jgi:hypothetical protein
MAKSLETPAEMADELRHVADVEPEPFAPAAHFDAPTPASVSPATEVSVAPAPKTVKLVALACRPMPEPVRAGLHFMATSDDAAKWVSQGWARTFVPAFDAEQHAHNGQPKDEDPVAA